MMCHTVEVAFVIKPPVHDCTPARTKTGETVPWWPKGNTWLLGNVLVLLISLIQQQFAGVCTTSLTTGTHPVVDNLQDLADNLNILCRFQKQPSICPTHTKGITASPTNNSATPPPLFSDSLPALKIS